MVKKENSDVKRDWQKADARVLGQIMAAQNIVFALPDITHIAQFYSQALISVPGIISCHVCLGHMSAHAGEMESSVCAECETNRKTAEDIETIIQANPDFVCKLADQPDMRITAIDSYQHHFGFFVFKIENATVFDVYQPFISNLANYIAIVLENRLQGNLLQKAHDELEHRVEERTAELKNANELLLQEITERKRAEESLRRLNRELRAISSCNQTLMRAQDEQSLLNDICRIICDEAGYRMLWVGYAEKDDARTIRPVAWAGFDNDYIAGAKLTWADDTERGQGPAGKAIRSGEIVCVQDFTTDPQMAIWRESALLRGYNSGIALPLKDESNARAFGVLLIYSGKINAFTPDEIRLLEELAGDLAYGIMVLRARTERKRAEEKILKLNRIYAVISQINQTIVRVHDKDKILSEACRIAVENGKFKMAWIGMIDEKTTLVNPVAYWGVEDGYLSKIKAISVEDEPAGRGPTGTAIREGWHNVCDDMEKDPRMMLWRKEALERGYRSSIALPIKHFGKVIGAFTIYAPVPHFFDQEEIHLLDEVTNDISFALESIEISIKKQETEEALKKSEEKYRRLTENARDMIYRMSLPDGAYEYVSPASTEIYGYSPEEFYSTPILIKEAIHPDWQDYFMKQWANLVKGEMPPFYEYQIIHKSGEMRWLHQRNVLVKDENGKAIAIEGIVTDITQRKQAEEEVRKKTLLLNQMGALAKVGAWKIDVSSMKQEWSDETYAIHDVDKKTYDPNVVAEISRFVPKDEPIIKKAVEEVIKYGKPYDLELEMVTVRGNHKFVRAIGKAEMEDRNITTVYGAVWDITQSKHAEEALRESEEKYRLLIASMAEGVTLQDASSVILAFNKSAEHILGLTSDQLFGRTSLDPRWRSIHEDGSPFPGETHPVTVALRTGLPQSDVIMGIRKPDGTLTWISINVQPIFKEGETTPYRVVATMHDITERKKAEEMQRKLSSAVEHTADIVVIARKDGTIEYVNPAFEKITGYTMEEAVGKTPRILKSGKQDKKFYENLWGTILSGEVYYGELINKKNNGELYYTEKTITPVIDEHGIITHFVSTDKDITERKKAEEVYHENRRLEAADKAKSEFLANMSHELRTPLNASIGFSELLTMGMAGELSEKQKHFVEIILTSNQFLLTLINDILDLSKIEAGKIDLVPAKMSVPETIKETLTLIKEKAMKHKVILKTEFDTELECIEADKQRFKQILFNLLSNAVKFSKEEGGTVTIAAKKEGDIVQISVSDTGIGIKEEYVGKLFRKFEQLEKGISQKYGGTGLGLAITKQLVELHGGRIWAQSKYGEGSTFTFLIPLKTRNGGL